MKRPPDLSLVLACYNEAPLFAQSVREILQVLRRSRYTFEIIFADDKSVDQTAGLIRKACARYPNVRALFHKKNCGRGRTVADGIRAARGTVVGYIDIDLEVSPIYIPEMVRKILDGEADVVIGKRIYRSSVGSLPREIFSLGYQWLADAMIGTGGLDTETGYKFFHRKKILPVVARAQHPHWFWDTEIMVYARRGGLRIAQVPVLFVRRLDKKSSVRMVRDIADYLVNLWRFRGHLAKVRDL